MADTYGPVEAVYKTTYAANVALAVQQKQSKLVPLTTNIANLSGTQMQVTELIGSSSAIVDGPDNATTPNIAPKHLGIYVKPRRIYWGRTIPRSTEIKAAVDYQSPYVQEGVAAIQRERDLIVMNAAFGNRLVVNAEDQAPTAVAFDTANRQLAVDYGSTGTNTGLVVKKIVAAISKLMAAEVDVDMEELILWHTAKQNEDLFKELQVTSKDYRDKAQFEEKRVTMFMGVRLQHFEKLPLASAGVRRCMLYAKSGLHCGDALPLTTQIERNPGMLYQPHPFMETWIGATRSEDEKFVDILCAE